MKLIIANIAMAAVANAGLDHIAADIGLLVAGNSSLWGDRSITAMMGNLGAVIDTYGCWCFFDEKHGQGKGSPVNDIDGACKTAAHGYDCAILDAAAAGEPECIPWEINYVGGSGQGPANLVANCDANNNGADQECARAACKVEGHFVTTFFNQFVSIGGSPIDTEYQHANPLATFDHLTDCVVGEGVNDRNRECCGQQPNRYPFKPFTGLPNEKECCSETVFPTGSQQCCDDGIPRFIGSCP
jgi:hypothetical protein